MPEAVTIPHDFSATPAFVLQSKGYVRIYWAQDNTTPDDFGCTMHTTLTFSHDSTPGGKQYRAILSEAPAAFDGKGGHREAMMIGNRPDRVLLSSELAPRYNARKFVEFVHSILGGNLPA